MKTGVRTVMSRYAVVAAGKEGRRGVAPAARAQHLRHMCPGREAALLTGGNNAREGAEGHPALAVARSVADAPGDDRVARGEFGGVVGQRQLGITEHDPERGLVIERLPAERARLGVPTRAVSGAQVAQRAERARVLFAQWPRRRSFAGRVGGGHHRLDARPQRPAEALGVPVEALFQAARLAPQMGKAAQAVVGVAIRPVAVVELQEVVS